MSRPTRPRHCWRISAVGSVWARNDRRRPPTLYGPRTTCLTMAVPDKSQLIATCRITRASFDKSIPNRFVKSRFYEILNSQIGKGTSRIWTSIQLFWAIAYEKLKIETDLKELRASRHQHYLCEVWQNRGKRHAHIDEDNGYCPLSIAHFNKEKKCKSSHIVVYGR